MHAVVVRPMWGAGVWVFICLRCRGANGRESRARNHVDGATQKLLLPHGVRGVWGQRGVRSVYILMVRATRVESGKEWRADACLARSARIVVFCSRLRPPPSCGSLYTVRFVSLWVSWCKELEPMSCLTLFLQARGRPYYAEDRTIITVIFIPCDLYS